MSTPVRVFGFLLALAAAFGIALGVGNAVGPFETNDEPAAHDGGHAEGHDPDQSSTTPAADIPGGLMVSQDGFTLELQKTRAEPGSDVAVAFTITGPDGAPVTAYDVEHDKQLHLIAVRRDFTGFQHVHPELAPDGTWGIDLDLTPGAWRLFADFKATGAEALTLGADLEVSGDHQPAAPAVETRTASVDGYEVTLDGELAPGTDAKLKVTVSKDGRPVTDLQPYLDAYGHLVALREGDLAYLHVHPDGTPGDGATEAGPDVVFYATVPSAGGYRLYLDFKHRGVVRTAAFAIDTAGTTPAANDEPVDVPTEAPADDGHADH
ncbi:hypothetical protein [Nocardioides sp. InS609-2]|uniref:hypothetical protein n=1 Tax=Nocardioides sp. InS609-2 TaxID=2760705 RepID=UPI0020BE08C8|nr:hypothetical protein [Nocardioides sp. InS609-2]